MLTLLKLLTALGMAALVLGSAIPTEILTVSFPYLQGKTTGFVLQLNIEPVWIQAILEGKGQSGFPTNPS